MQLASNPRCNSPWDTILPHTPQADSASLKTALLEVPRNPIQRLMQLQFALIGNGYYKCGN